MKISATKDDDVPYVASVVVEQYDCSNTVASHIYEVQGIKAEEDQGMCVALDSPPTDGMLFAA